MLDELFAAEINSSRQWLFIRGAERPRAVVLFVHGGPGYPLMWYSRAFDGHLLKDFAVVHWDQRAAGKSASKCESLDAVSIDQIVSDGLVVTEIIRNRFPNESLVLVGHSWGTIIAANMAAQRPQRFVAYISIGTTADWLRGEQLRYDRLVELAAGLADSDHSRQLQRLGPPPYDTADQIAQFGEIILAIVGFAWTSRQLTETQLAEAMITNEEYSDDELNTAFAAISKNIDHLSPSLNRYVLSKAVPRLTLPIFFAEGSHDMTTPISLARDYFEQLDAPAGKHWVEFENSAHMPMYEEPDQFRKLLHRLAKPL